VAARPDLIVPLAPSWHASKAISQTVAVGISTGWLQQIRGVRLYNGSGLTQVGAAAACPVSPLSADRNSLSRGGFANTR
jgi:hypothetical protein